MTNKEFEKILLDSLNSLSAEDIKRIRNKYNTSGDWGVDEMGRSYLIKNEEKNK